MSYVPDPDRYSVANFRRCGRSGLQLPAISLGLWQNFGGNAVEGVRLLIHQPSYSMFNRWIETDGLIDTLGDLGVGCTASRPWRRGSSPTNTSTPSRPTEPAQRRAARSVPLC